MNGKKGLVTGTGWLLLPPLVPFPSWPLLLLPQHLAIPVESSSQACLSPAVTAIAFVIPVTATALGELLGDPELPSWPTSFFPQQAGAPVPRRAQVNSDPAATPPALTVPEMPETESVPEGETVPLPCSPISFLPQQRMVPPTCRAHV